MQDLTRAQKARAAVRNFQTIAHALALRGFFRPSGRMGQSLAECLQTLSPEIYASMNDPRVVELKGLEYVSDRLPRGIEACNRIILTEESDFTGSAFERIVPLKRRRTCYRISEKVMCFLITRGLSEIYDILTHLTFLNIEAMKIWKRMRDEAGHLTIEWHELEAIATRKAPLPERELENALIILSLIVGRPYHETRETYEHFDRNRREHQSNDGFFSWIYNIGKRIDEEHQARENSQVIYLTPSLMSIIGHQKYGADWAREIKARLVAAGLSKRPLHIISANLHSVMNLLYAYAAFQSETDGSPEENFYEFIRRIRNRNGVVFEYARKNGLHEVDDHAGTHINCQIIDIEKLVSMPLHPELCIEPPNSSGEMPVLLVIDYAFGAQAFEVMDNLLKPISDDPYIPMNVRSISIMGKAGILTGHKGEIMLATAHVIEGTSDNYIFENDLLPEDFDPDWKVHVGPMVTVVGTSLQNRDMLQKFQESWRTVGLEMEGAHYHRAINAAIIKGNIPRDVKVRYAYYASDNPLVSGQTLAAGEMGDEGIKPTYMVTKVITRKILCPTASPRESMCLSPGSADARRVAHIISPSEPCRDTAEATGDEGTELETPAFLQPGPPTEER